MYGPSKYFTNMYDGTHKYNILHEIKDKIVQLTQNWNQKKFRENPNTGLEGAPLFVTRVETNG